MMMMMMMIIVIMMMMLLARTQLTSAWVETWPDSSRGVDLTDGWWN